MADNTTPNRHSKRVTRKSKGPKHNAAQRSRLPPTPPTRATSIDSPEVDEVSAVDGIFGPGTSKSPRYSVEIALDPPLLTPPPSNPSISSQSRSRRTSEKYPLFDEDVLAPSRLVSGKRLGTPDNSEDPSRKRVKFVSLEDDTDSSSDDHLDDIPSVPKISPRYLENVNVARQSLRLNSNSISHPHLVLLESLLEQTVPLRIEEVSALLRTLQKLTGDFASRYFAGAANDNEDTINLDMSTFPLQDLRTKHYALYLTTINVLDASTIDDGWLKFFAHPNYRPYLVYAVLGEWFCQRIFKDTAFGLSLEGRTNMADQVDKKYMYYDSFIRAKKRSIVVRDYRKQPGAGHWLEQAASNLAGELMIVLAPLMPFFRASDPHNKNLTPADETHKHEIQSALERLIRLCGATNLAIVRTGENGTIVRPANRLENGRQYFSTAPMECINSEMLHPSDYTTYPVVGKELVVRMTCWPRMEAWVPHGPDKEEMYSMELQLRRTQLPSPFRRVDTDNTFDEVEHDEAKQYLCWDCSPFLDRWKVLPRELWHVDAERRERQRMLWRLDDLDRCTRGGVEQDADFQMETTTVHDAPPSKSNPPRGAWVTEYTCLAPHTVYCEWTKPETSSEEVVPKEGETAIKRINNLEDAVKQARKSLIGHSSIMAAKDDLLLKLWNFYASHNLAIEWSTFLIGVLILVARRRSWGLISPVAGTGGLVASLCAQISEVLGITALVGGGYESRTAGMKGLPLRPDLDNMFDSATTFVNQNMTMLKSALGSMFAGLGSKLLPGEVASMKYFTGQRQPFTSNPLDQLTDSLRFSARPLSGVAFASTTARASTAGAAATAAATVKPVDTMDNLWRRVFSGWTGPVVDLASDTNQLVQSSEKTLSVPRTAADAVSATELGTASSTDSDTSPSESTTSIMGLFKGILDSLARSQSRSVTLVPGQTHAVTFPRGAQVG